MKKRILILSILGVISYNATAMSVFDSVAAANAAVQLAYDKAMDALKIEHTLADQGLQVEQLTHAMKSLEQLEETFDRLTEVYDTAQTIQSNIGDPSKLVAYLNTRFVKSQDVDKILSLTNKIQNAELSDIDSRWVKSTMRTADQILNNKQMENEAMYILDEKKRYDAMSKSGDQIIDNVKANLQKLEQADSDLNPRTSALNDLMYAMYQTNQFANQMTATQMIRERDRQEAENALRQKELEEKQALLDDEARAIIAEDERIKTAQKNRKEDGEINKRTLNLYKQIRGTK